MKRGFILLGIVLALISGTAWAQTQTPVSILADLDPNASTGIRIEGLVADAQGRLYTSDLDSRRFFRITPSTGLVEPLTILPRPASGMAFDAPGNLFLASGDQILRIPAERIATGIIDPAVDVQTYATGVPGANGLAFDEQGRLFVSGGATGTIYLVPPGGPARVLINGLTSDRQAQQISTNGLAFGPDGRLYSANTGSGAIDRFIVLADGTTTPVERWITNPLLFGADGITFAINGDLFVAVNERNAIVRITPDGQVTDIAANGNVGPLEFPASPAFAGDALYVSNFDIARGSNAPNEAGLGASIAKIEVKINGAPLPFRGVPAQPLPTITPTAAPTTIPVSLPNTGELATTSSAPWLLGLAITLVLASLLVGWRNAQPRTK